MQGHSWLPSVLVFLVAVVIAVPLARKLKLGSVLGYLAAGVVIGPYGLHWVRNPDAISGISEFGVALLLFVIGLELSPQRLWVMRRAVFGAGAAQVIGSALAIGLIAVFGFHLEPVVAAVVGLGLAFSSTAFGLQILAERRELQSPHGRQAFAILLFQDLVAIPLIAAIPLLATHGATPTPGQPLWLSALRVAGVIAVVVVGGRYALRPVFRAVAKTQLIEVSTATALLVVIGVAWLMQLAGISMALGTFLAGVLLADSEYRHELESNIAPFEGLLLGLFFITVGMGVNLHLLMLHPWIVVGLVVLLLALKAPVLAVVGRLSPRMGGPDAVKLAALLAGGGEFAFVVFKLAAEHGLLTRAQHELLVLVVTLGMAAVPLLVLAAARMPQSGKPSREYDTIDAGTPRVIIAGFGRVGQIVGRMLRARNIPFVALENSIEQVDLSRRFAGTEIYFGDPSRAEILRAAQAGKAEVFVLATDDPAANVRTARLVRRMFPHLKIIARARNRQHAFRLMDLASDPDDVVRETFHSSLKMARLTLKALGMGEEQAHAVVELFREHDEKLLRDQHLVYDDDVALRQTTREAYAELQGLFEADSQARVEAPAPTRDASSTESTPAR
ncbi:MAG TPA: monovalent cation:proton antiporter-2 (CPA2) family protein [Rhodanobacteraceae bacterium]|nr:monovalent cation:proton antiporter-2 (CPA2) family protein [Rhodanobacteraceae bacterium]